MNTLLRKEAENDFEKYLKILRMMLKKDLIHQIMRLTDLCLQERIKR